MPVTDELDALIDQLDQAQEDQPPGSQSLGDASGDAIGNTSATAPSKGGDALDRIRNTPARQSRTRRLRDTDLVRQFREDLTNGLVRVDRLNQVLELLSSVIKRVLRA